MSSPPVDRSRRRRFGLAARMLTVLLAMTVLNLLFGAIGVAIVLSTVIGGVLLAISVILSVAGVVVDIVLGVAGLVVDTLGPLLGPVVSVLGIGLPSELAFPVIRLGGISTLLARSVVVFLWLLYGLLGLLLGLLGLVLAFVLPVVGEPTMLKSDLEATPVDTADYPRASGTLERVARSAGVPTPELAVVESPDPQSFAAGRKNDGTVVVTTGLLDALDDDELAAVLAHEVSHLGNRDSLVMSYAACYPLLWADPPDESEPSGDEGPDGGDESSSGDDGDDGDVEEEQPPVENWVEGAKRRLRSLLWLEKRPGEGIELQGGAIATAVEAAIFLVESVVFLVGILSWSALVLAYVVGVVLYYSGMVVAYVAGALSYPVLWLAARVGWLFAAFLSRSREYAADRGAAAITGDPAALASALETLRETGVPESDLRSVSEVEPLAVLPFEHSDVEGSSDPFWSRTHPPTETRIERLRGMARRQERE